MARLRQTAESIANAAEYRTWRGLFLRCHTESGKRDPRYGGRGIEVHADWHGPDGFQRFLAHVGPKPHPAMQIDRIDNDGHYEPGNVQWITRSQNCRNRRRGAAVAVGDSEASRQLRCFILTHGISYREVGEALHVSGVTAHQWAHGVRTPSRGHREDIAVWTEDAVPITGWGPLPQVRSFREGR